jgi:hypothetical protein
MRKKKKVVEEAVKKKAIEEAVVRKRWQRRRRPPRRWLWRGKPPKRKATDEAAAKKKALEEAVKKTESAVATADSGPSSAPLAGVKMVATPSGSTPSVMRQFHGSWKPRYATRPFICHFLYCVYDFNLVSPAYSVPSSGRSPPSGGPNVIGAAQVVEPQDSVEAQLSDEAVGGDGVLVSSAAVAVGVVTQVATNGVSLASEVLRGGATNVTTEEVATDDPASLASLSGGTCFSTVATDDGGAMEPEVILGHPTLRAPGDVSLDEAMGTAHWTLTQAQNVLHWESGGIIDEWWRLLLWASMLKERTTVEARQQHLDGREELLNKLQTAINSRDHDSQWMLAEAKELYATTEARV